MQCFFLLLWPIQKSQCLTKESPVSTSENKVIDMTLTDHDRYKYPSCFADVFLCQTKTRRFLACSHLQCWCIYSRLVLKGPHSVPKIPRTHYIKLSLCVWIIWCCLDDTPFDFGTCSSEGKCVSLKAGIHKHLNTFIVSMFD